MLETDKLFPIGYVSRFTGLSTHVIRVWEKRYAAVTPRRSSGNRRLYSQGDVRRLGLLQKAVMAGQNISNAAKMDNRELELLAASVSEKREDPGRIDAGEPLTADAAIHLKRCQSAVLDLDDRRLEIVLRDAAVDLSKLSLMTDVISVLFQKVGQLWARGSIKVIHEHMASSVTQGFLWEMLRSSAPVNFTRAMVIATPAGQWCQIGALMAAVAASDAGWRAYYFGPDLPAEEIAAAAKKTQAACVALSISFRGEKNLMVRELTNLRKILPPDVDIVLGGPASSAFQNTTQKLGIRRFSGLRVFFESLVTVAPPDV